MGWDFPPHCVWIYLLLHFSLHRVISSQPFSMHSAHRSACLFCHVLCEAIVSPYYSFVFISRLFCPVVSTALCCVNHLSLICC